MTLQQLTDFLESEERAKKYLGPLNVYLPARSIDTPLEIASFMAQTAQESQGYSRLREVTNYTAAERLLEIFPKYFTARSVKEYVGKPEAIASRVYANRLGNGNEWTGDGYRYRGAGLLQHTGKTAFLLLGARLHNDNQFYIKNPEYLLRPDDATAAAAYTWEFMQLNQYCKDQTPQGFITPRYGTTEKTRHLVMERSPFERQTIRINGGLNGYEERRQWLKKALTIFR